MLRNPGWNNIQVNKSKTQIWQNDKRKAARRIRSKLQPKFCGATLDYQLFGRSLTKKTRAVEVLGCIKANFIHPSEGQCQMMFRNIRTVAKKKRRGSTLSFREADSSSGYKEA